jgi:hypothetical protein
MTTLLCPWFLQTSSETLTYSVSMAMMVPFFGNSSGARGVKESPVSGLEEGEGEQGRGGGRREEGGR